MAAKSLNIFPITSSTLFCSVFNVTGVIGSVAGLIEHAGELVVDDGASNEILFGCPFWFDLVR